MNDTMDIEVTTKAKTELLRAFNGLEGNNIFLRIGVVPGGCSGQKYTAVPDTELKTDDVVLFDDGDIKLVSDEGSAMFLDGLKVDFSDDLVRSGFQFMNPSASGACGCGASFAG